MKKLLLPSLLCLCTCGDPLMPATTPVDLGASPDLAVEVDMAFASDCGSPGDIGNSLGVGRFCERQSDCRLGTFCTHPFSPLNYFCTIPCSMSGPPSQCGENAGCECDAGQCGCVPVACLGPPPG